MNGMKPVQLAHADLWLSDHYLRLGLESIFATMTFDSPSLRYVFFTEKHYADVLAQRYDLNKHRLILLTEGYLYNFLTDIPLHRLSARSTVSEMEAFIAAITYGKGRESVAEKRVRFTARERLLIDLIKDGKKMAEMGAYFNVHTKTVYQIRQTVIRKMGCSGMIDFLRTLRSDVFSNWLVENHRVH